jgi:hypothetical protein
VTDTSIYEIVDGLEQSLRDRIAKTSGYPGLATYTGYAHGNEGPAAWYSSMNLPRLSVLKKNWEPDGLFVFNKPIPVQVNVPTGSVGLLTQVTLRLE